MASSLLGNLISTTQAFRLRDRATGVDVLGALAVIRVEIALRSIPQRHMREDGITLVDTRTIVSSELRATVIAKDLAQVEQLNSILQNRSTTYLLITRGIYLGTMMMSDESMKQVPDVLSAAPMTLTFKQLLIQDTTPVICAQSADSSVVDRGLALVQSVSDSASDLYNNVTSAINRVF